MRVLTLGAGTVGRWVADMLCRRGHSVTVVDSNAANVQRINSELDVKAIVGSASRSTVLFQAEVSSADMCLAVTGDDEVNIVAASMAKAKFSTLLLGIAKISGPVITTRNTSLEGFTGRLVLPKVMANPLTTATK